MCLFFPISSFRDRAPTQNNRNHYKDVIMSAMASQITGVSIVNSTVCWGTDLRKHYIFFRATCLCAGNSLVTGEFPVQGASNTEMFFLFKTSSYEFSTTKSTELGILNSFLPSLVQSYECHLRQWRPFWKYANYASSTPEIVGKFLHSLYGLF